jgi:multiple sugar transport system permease protein
MLSNKRDDAYVGAILIAPMFVVFCLIFVYPTLQMIAMSFTDSPLIGWGDWVGFHNYAKELSSPVFWRAVLNTVYFVVLSVIPGTILALLIALGINRQRGWIQAVILACFFLPSILPVSVVTATWGWMVNLQYGVLQPIFSLFNGGQPTSIFKSQSTFMPMVAAITIWWGIGFNILLFIAALRNVSPDIYEAAAIDNAKRLRIFFSITWPLIWPVTTLVLTLSLIAQLKIFTQAFLFGEAASASPSVQNVVMKLVYNLAFVSNKGGEGATVATLLFVMIIATSIILNRVLSAGGKK